MKRRLTDEGVKSICTVPSMSSVSLERSLYPVPAVFLHPLVPRPDTFTPRTSTACGEGASGVKGSQVITIIL